MLLNESSDVYLKDVDLAKCYFIITPEGNNGLFKVRISTPIGEKIFCNQTSEVIWNLLFPAWDIWTKR